jgi:hypothetical protein
MRTISSILEAAPLAAIIGPIVLSNGFSPGYEQFPRLGQTSRSYFKLFKCFEWSAHCTTTRP